MDLNTCLPACTAGSTFARMGNEQMVARLQNASFGTNLHTNAPRISVSHGNGRTCIRT